MTTGDMTKICPFCGEQILAVAIKCKHCQSTLDAAQLSGHGPPIAYPPPPATSAVPHGAGDGLGVVLLLTPWLGVALLWFWVAETPLIAASNNLTMVGAIVVIGTAILATVDASNLGFGVKGTPAARASSPFGTFIGILLLWAIMYPVHMHERAKYGGRKKQIGGALLGMIAFFASLVYLGMLINDKLSQIRQAFGSY